MKDGDLPYNFTKIQNTAKKHLLNSNHLLETQNDICTVYFHQIDILFVGKIEKLTT